MTHWNPGILPGIALKATAVLGVAWVLALLFRRRSAAWRHLIWTCAFAALLLLPLLSVSLPVLPVNVSGPVLPAGALFRAAAAVPTEIPPPPGRLARSTPPQPPRAGGRAPLLLPP